jgi:predicted dehydrogenase
MKKYRWGIISTANIGPKAMIHALKASEMAEVAAVASRDLEKAQQFADDLKIKKAYGSYKDLLDDDKIDAVYIPLPNHLHKEWSIRTAEAGKHILCEKPLALNPEECTEMKDAAEANGVLLMEAFMYRHHPRILAAKEMVRTGAVGDLKVINASFTFKLNNKEDIRYQPEMGGGAVMDVGCYCINIIRLMTGREPKVVQARAEWAPSGVDDMLVAMLDFGDGLIAHFDCGFNMESRQRCTIAGTDGYLSLPRTYTPGLHKCIIREHKGPQSSKKHRFEGVDEYRLIAEDFMRAIPDGKPPYDADDAAANLRVIQACLISARQNGDPVVI